MTKMENKVPLVSIIIISYNSSKYILETLESAKSQSYSNIELIVSDDCSTDNTVEICKNWLDRNGARFLRSEIITIKKNTGTSGNCNRGINAATGKWIKLIAGDDTLLPNCVMDNINFVTKNQNDALVVQSNLNVYRNDFTDKNFVKSSEIEKDTFYNKNITAKKQHSLLLQKNHVLGVTIFIKKEVFSIVGYDEEIRLLDDYPFWLNITKAGIKILSFKSITANYRVHYDSVIKKGNPFMSTEYAKQLLLFANKYLKPEILFSSFLIYSSALKFVILLNKLGLNRNYLLSRVLYLRVVPRLLVFSIYPKKV